MRRGEAWKALRDHGGWMRLSERAVFLALLERADNTDCKIPDFMTPSLEQLAKACCGAKSTVTLALDHLERHAWVTRTRIDRPGRGQKTTYQLHHGCQCECSKESDRRTLSRQKGSDRRTAKGSDSHSQTRRSTRVSPEGSSEGEGRQGSSSARSCFVCKFPIDPVLSGVGFTAHPLCEFPADVTKATA